MRVLFISLFVLLTFAFNAEARYVLVSWDAVTGATSYTLSWGAVSGGPYTYSVTGITETEYQFSMNEVTTYVVVTAVDGTGESVESTELAISHLVQDGNTTSEQIAVLPPDDSFPDSMTETMLNAEASYVLVSWDAVTGATSYTLSWGAVSGGPYTYSVTDITDTEYQFSMDEETTYVVVTAVDGTGESVESTELTISHLLQDGPPTPEQISIYLPFDPADYSATMTATMRHRKAGTESWITGHDLYHIVNNKDSGDGFAWVILDLDQGTDYAVEVTTHDGSDDVIYKTLMSTRSLPPAAGPVTTTIPAGSDESYIESVFSAASAGDVIQFENGTYTTTGLALSNSGEEGNPIYIRGESRAGVVIQDTDGTIFNFSRAEHIVLENVTLQGYGADVYGDSTNSIGIHYWSGYTNEENRGDVTIRYMNILGVDKAIYSGVNSKQLLIYENYIEGNNNWEQDLWSYEGAYPDGTADIDQNMMWNDDGIYVAGSGNSVFNNTITGFGDTFAVQGSNPTDNHAIHFYRNLVLMSGDDTFEPDYGRRNVTFYDNQILNCMTLFSADPWSAGPLIIARNIVFNVGRQFVKPNDATGPMDGIFVYNNTMVKTVASDTYATKIWTTFKITNDSDWNQWGFENNILMAYNDADGLGGITIEVPDIGPIDFTHNSWYPDGIFKWTNTGGYMDDLAYAQANLSATTAYFGTSTQRHSDDLIIEEQPFETEVIMPAVYTTELTTAYIPTLLESSNSKNTGIAIVGITDGYSGVAPDRGAIIEGRDLVTYGASESGETGTSAKMPVIIRISEPSKLSVACDLNSDCAPSTPFHKF